MFAVGLMSDSGSYARVWFAGGRRRGVAAGAACALGSLALAVAEAQAAPIAVDIEADTLAADGHCSLREAITAANNDVAPFMGAGECAAGAVSDVVTLPAGHFALSRTGVPDDTNVNGDLDVLGAGLTIRGQGSANTTIDANRIDRVLDVLASRTATLEGVTVTGGQAPKGANGGNVSGPPGMQGRGENGEPGEPGGGIRNAGTLTITDSTISDNRAGAGGDGGLGTGGGGTTGSTGTGGGFGSGGDATFFSGGHGGGIFTSGALTLTRVTVTGNRAGNGGKGGNGFGGQGGAGISGDGGNGGGGRGGDGGRGGNGGGIAVAAGGTLTIDLSTISGNLAGDGGANGNGQGGAGGVTSGDDTVGGIGGFGAGGSFGGGFGGFGGGIYSPDPITVTRSEISGNRTGAGGDAGNGTGGLGGHGIDDGMGNTATGGHGGPGMGDDGGDAGFGGGVQAPGEFVNVTIQANGLGDGGDGGDGKGGNGGASIGGPAGAAGGFGSGGDGGTGGVGGGLLAGSSATTTRHATITANAAGTGGAGGTGTGGNGGSPGGTAGGANNGFAGFSGGVGGIIGGSLANSVVAGNENSDCSTGMTDGGHNFTFPGDSCPGATIADPQLGPLAANGGPTMTQALLPGSPLIDAVPAGPDCAGTDQRGLVRPQGPACDVGAYEVGVPIPPGPDTEAPSFLAASLKPARFAVNRRGAAEAPVAARTRRGTTFRFRLSEAARVVFTIEQARPGRRVKRRCVKPRRSNRRRPKCTRFTGARRFAVTAAAGGNVKKFSGRIGRRALKPGRYRATLVATDAAGNASAPKRLRLRVVRR
jgi:CSLREA domain-containing protein